MCAITRNDNDTLEDAPFSVHDIVPILSLTRIELPMVFVFQFYTFFCTFYIQRDYWLICYHTCLFPLLLQILG